MIIVPYDKWHRLSMAELLESRDMDLDNLNRLPEVGYIVYKDKSPVAAGFLRQCENSFGMLDSYVTNPRHSSKDRHAALELITNRLIESAKFLNIKELIALSKDNGIIKRAIENKFVSVPLSISILKLH